MFRVEVSNRPGAAASKLIERSLGPQIASSKVQIAIVVAGNQPFKLFLAVCGR